MKYLYVILGLVWISTGCATSRLQIEGKNLNRYIEESSVLGNSFSGFILYDPAKQEIIHEYHGHRFFTPASNTKILTFYTAGKILSDSIPSLIYTLRNDTLYFSGLEILLSSIRIFNFNRVSISLTRNRGPWCTSQPTLMRKGSALGGPGMIFLMTIPLKNHPSHFMAIWSGSGITPRIQLWK